MEFFAEFVIITIVFIFVALLLIGTYYAYYHKNSLAPFSQKTRIYISIAFGVIIIFFIAGIPAIWMIFDPQIEFDLESILFLVCLAFPFSIFLMFKIFFELTRLNYWKKWFDSILSRNDKDT